MAAAKQQAPDVKIRVDEIRDVVESLDTVEQEANSFGHLVSAVIEFEDYLAEWDGTEREWTLKGKSK